MSALAWTCNILGLLVIATSIIGIIADCKKASPLMGKSQSQCSGFYAVLMLSGVLFIVIGVLLMMRAKYY